MKAARHATILQIIEHSNIETQDDLTEHLKEHGFDVTQATVSRDIKELRLIKVLAANGHYKYATVDKAETGMQERFIKIFMQSVLTIDAAGNIAVIKTIPGSANVAAEAIDSMKWPEIIGTLAGDNTIFVVGRNTESMPHLIEKFHTMMR
jgi:transcriptional regulator of arginine metabolism